AAESQHSAAIESQARGHQAEMQRVRGEVDSQRQRLDRLTRETEGARRYYANEMATLRRKRADLETKEASIKDYGECVSESERSMHGLAAKRQREYKEREQKMKEREVALDQEQRKLAMLAECNEENERAIQEMNQRRQEKHQQRERELREREAALEERLAQVEAGQR
ncbi:hypothetical protein KIPB_005702, partial [Kipferlia bialata]